MQRLGEEKVFGNYGLSSFFPGKVTQEIASQGKGRRKGWDWKKNVIGAVLQRFALKFAQDLPQQQCMPLLCGLRWEEELNTLAEFC